MNNSTHSNVTYSNSIFKRYLMQISTGIIWKDTSKAAANETADLAELYQIELFVVANRGLLNFDIVKSFPRSVLANVPDVRANDIEIYASDKRKIPVGIRAAVVKEYAKALTSIDPISGRPAYYNTNSGKYETIYNEPNNYYRMLMGLPDKGDADFIFNTDPRWSTTTPIHEMPKVDRIEMERAGILDELLIKYPSKKYIEFLGKKYIDPFMGRIADRFEILYSNSTESGVLNKDFTDAYNSARRTVLSVYYNNSIRKSNSNYDNFLAMCILFITLQIMQYKYLKVDITRDFYDTESLKLVYDSYGVPFYNEIPLEYHQKIVKNINKLISYKGSSKVFFDLFDIFNAGSMDIYSYFLTKTHLVDENGIPYFNIKKDFDGNPLYDSDGNPILDESNYQINFSRVKIYDDPALSISDENNNVEYETVVTADPYWIEDEELAKKLASEEFNYLESKYIGVQTVYDLMKITYENAYIFRLITDNRKITEMFEFRWTDIGINCNIFDVFIYLAALYCRYYGYEGLISNNIPAVMDTLGYNFDESAKLLRYIYNSNSSLRNNTELINLLTNLNLTNLNSIDAVYKNIDKIRDLIIAGYTDAKTLDEYNLYRDMYNSLLVSKEITASYSDANGNIYETFTDMLSDISPELMQRYLLLDDNEIENEVIAATDKIEDIITSSRYLLLSSGMLNNKMFEPLFKILKFFKSAKAELVDYNIVYTISMRGINFFKMMDLISGITNEYTDSEYTHFIDIMKTMNEMVRHRHDMIEMLEEISDLQVKSYINDYIKYLSDDILYFSEIIDMLYRDSTWYIDFIQTACAETKISSYLVLEDLSNPEMSMLDIVESRYSGLIKDSINRLSDSLKITNNKPIIYYLLESMIIMDKIKTARYTVYGKKSNISSNLISHDTLTSLDLTKEKIKDILKLNTIINYIESTISIRTVHSLHSEMHLANYVIDSVLSSNEWYNDILEKISQDSSIDDVLSLSDVFLTSKISYDDIAIRYKELIKDNLSVFRDVLRDLTTDDKISYIRDTSSFNIALNCSEYIVKMHDTNIDNLTLKEKIAELLSVYTQDALMTSDNLLDKVLSFFRDGNKYISRISQINNNSEKYADASNIMSKVYYIFGSRKLALSKMHLTDNLLPIIQTNKYTDNEHSIVRNDDITHLWFNKKNDSENIFDESKSSLETIKGREDVETVDCLFEFDSSGNMKAVT